MQIYRFEEIIAWKKAKDLNIELYRLFSSHKDFNFRDQLLRASISIMNNIAEGFERRSNKEFKQFLYISKGSSAEVRSMLYIALELHYISSEKSQTLILLTEEIARLLSGLIKTL
jgi:four helix bundle protein